MMLEMRSAKCFILPFAGKKKIRKKKLCSSTALHLSYPKPKKKFPKGTKRPSSLPCAGNSFIFSTSTYHFSHFTKSYDMYTSIPFTSTVFPPSLFWLLDVEDARRGHPAMKSMLLPLNYVWLRGSWIEALSRSTVTQFPVTVLQFTVIGSWRTRTHRIAIKQGEYIWSIEEIWTKQYPKNVTERDIPKSVVVTLSILSNSRPLSPSHQ